MSEMSRFLWLMWMMPDFFFYAWPVTLTLLVLSGGSFAGWLFQEHRPRLKLGRLTIGLVLAGFILLCGTLFYSESSQSPHSNAGMGSAMILGLLFGQLALSILLVVRASRGARLLSGCILASEFFVSFVAAIVALMSLGGTWL